MLSSLCLVIPLKEEWHKEFWIQSKHLGPKCGFTKDWIWNILGKLFYHLAFSSVLIPALPAFRTESVTQECLVNWYKALAAILW
jgi:hypothetical protein